MIHNFNPILKVQIELACPARPRVCWFNFVLLFWIKRGQAASLSVCHDKVVLLCFFFFFYYYYYYYYFLIVPKKSTASLFNKIIHIFFFRKHIGIKLFGKLCHYFINLLSQTIIRVLSKRRKLSDKYNIYIYIHI